MRTHLSKTFLADCKKNLLEQKVEILNRLSDCKASLQVEREVGDSGDISSRLMEENELLSFRSQWTRQLYEIEAALSRIENGSYGFCEETEEPIEPQRLKALPWTRFSLEGAELRSVR